MQENDHLVQQLPQKKKDGIRRVFVTNCKFVSKSWSIFEPVECHCWRAWRERGQSSPTGAAEEEDQRPVPHNADLHPEERQKRV